MGYALLSSLILIGVLLNFGLSRYRDVILHNQNSQYKDKTVSIFLSWKFQFLEAGLYIVILSSAGVTVFQS